MRLGGIAEMVNLSPEIRRLFKMVGIFKIIPEINDSSQVASSF